MKYFNLLLFFLFFLLLMNSNCHNPDGPGNSGERIHVNGTIRLRIQYKWTSRPVEGAEIIKVTGTTTIKLNPTDQNGHCIVSNIKYGDKLICAKSGELGQSIFLFDFSNLDGVTLFFKSSSTSFTDINILGYVFDKNGNPVQDVTVESGTLKVLTDSTGLYKLILPNGGHPYDLKFTQGTVSSSIKIGADQDTALVDVYINGLIPKTGDQASEQNPKN